MVTAYVKRFVYKICVAENRQEQNKSTIDKKEHLTAESP